VQYLQWYTSESRTLRAGASSTGINSKTGVAVPENSDWHLTALRGTFADGEEAWGTAGGTASSMLAAGCSDIPFNSK